MSKAKKLRELQEEVNHLKWGLQRTKRKLEECKKRSKRTIGNVAKMKLE